VPAAGASFVTATGATETTGGGLLAGASTGWFETVAASETFPLSAEVVDCGRRAFDTKTMTPNKPAASSSMATTTFGLILQGSRGVLIHHKNMVRYEPIPYRTSF
jgi:hypothetical protein